jgi:hypothetical protein
MFPTWGFLIYFQFFSSLFPFLLHFISLFLPFVAFYFSFHIHVYFILHFAPSLHIPSDRHTQNVLQHQ